MTEHKTDVVSWVEENLTLPAPDSCEAQLRLHPFQQAIVDAMSDPDVKVVYRKPHSVSFDPVGMVAVLSEAEKAEQRRATYAAADAAQDLAGKRAAALSPDRVIYSPGSTDKKLARDLGRRLLSDRPFTPRQMEIAAYLAWRYRRQISGRLVPGAPVAKP